MTAKSIVAQIRSADAFLNADGTEANGRVVAVGACGKTLNIVLDSGSIAIWHLAPSMAKAVVKAF